MARTPLMADLRHVFKQLKIAREHNMSLPEFREKLAEQHIKTAGIAGEKRALLITRREFMAGLAALSAAAALPKLARASGEPRIAIVGAGIAGLSCALKLADAGVPSTLYEASSRVGGRMFSNNAGYWQNQQVSEWCGELIDTDHVTIQALATRFGLPLDDLLAAQPKASEDTCFFKGQYYSKAQADKDFVAIFDIVTADMEAVGENTLHDDISAAGRRFDAMSIADWISKKVPGGLESPMGQLLRVAYEAEFGADLEDQSALNLLWFLADQPVKNRFSIFGTSDERYHLRGGNEQLPRAIATHLGGERMIRFESSLLKVAQKPDKQYQLTFETHGKVYEERADMLVLALPFAALKQVDYQHAGFDALKQRAIQELGCGANSKLQLQFDTRFWNGRGPWPKTGNGSTFADTGYQSSWEVSRAQSGTTGILNLYSGGSVARRMTTNKAFATARVATTKADAVRALAQIERVFPGLSAHWNGLATQSLPHKSDYFGASYAYYRIGQYAAFCGYEGVPQGNVYFCGEHTSVDYQGYMEGGAAEGETTAKKILAKMGR